LDEDPGPLRIGKTVVWIASIAFVAVMVQLAGAPVAGSQEPGTADATHGFLHYFPPEILVGLVILTGFSGFFSASEVAFLSIHRVRLRAMQAGNALSGRMVAALLAHPARLLNTILIGNMIMNVLISVLLPARLEAYLGVLWGLSPALNAVLTVCLSTAFLVFFGEITPKVIAVEVSESFARGAAIPMWLADRILAPVRWGSLRFTELLFRLVRFHDILPAPFLTDDELINVLSEGEAHGVIEEEEGQMIQGILVSGDAFLREILVPRHQMVALEREATVAHALGLFRENAFSRMPVYQEDLDHITGVLVAKDLLPYVVRGELDRPVGPIARRPSFVPETMTLRDFIRYSQRRHMHLSIVVDEYGGTEGLVTLDDAIEEVVGDIRDAAVVDSRPYRRVGRGVYIVDGGLPLDELNALLGVSLESEGHETVAGFVIDHLGKVPEKGDRLEHDGARFTVETVDGKRAASLRVETTPRQQETAP